MKVLELFAGSRSVGKVANQLGWEVFSSDFEAFEGIDYQIDILKFDVSKVPFKPDIIWASPPCTGFSVAAIGRNWEKTETDAIPKTDTARLGI
jgi:site-specific DNA-cytosine methylase